MPDLKNRLVPIREKVLEEARANEREANANGYCRHGVYVGGMGVDLMCHTCEMGDFTLEEEVDNYVDRVVAELDDLREMLVIIERREARYPRPRVSDETWRTLWATTMKEYLEDPIRRQIWDAIKG